MSEHAAAPALSGAEYTQNAAISLALVLSAGIASGLTMALCTMDVTQLQVLRNAGTEDERANAAKILPLVQQHHSLLVTLLLLNACVLEALPIFLNKICTSEAMAILLSVLGVLVFGEIVPQAVCTKYGLAIGAKMAPLVQLLMLVGTPVSYPIVKLLDRLLGHEGGTYFRRAELKELLSLHAIGHGNTEATAEQLQNDEVTMIKGVLDLASKTARTVMTPWEDVYSLDAAAVLEESLLRDIVEHGYSRVPVTSGGEVVDVLLVANLILVDPKAGVSVREACRGSSRSSELVNVGESTPLYEVLDLFQTGRSHLAFVREAAADAAASPLGDFDRTASEQRGGCGAGALLGVLSLEDVVEEVIQEEIEDEADRLRHQQSNLADSTSPNASPNPRERNRSMLAMGLRRMAIEATISSSSSSGASGGGRGGHLASHGRSTSFVVDVEPATPLPWSKSNKKQGLGEGLMGGAAASDA